MSLVTYAAMVPVVILDYCFIVVARIVTPPGARTQVMEQCDQLQDHGLDLGFVLWRMLEPRTLDAIEDAGIALVGVIHTTRIYRGDICSAKTFISAM